MNDPFTELYDAVTRVTHRPVPPPWRAAGPGLGSALTLGDITTMLRDGGERADRIIRVLLALAPSDPLAGVVVIAAVARHLDRMVGRNVTSEYRQDLLSNLAVVVLDPGEVDQLTGLARRLARRAHSKTARLDRVERRRCQRVVGLGDWDAPSTLPAVETTALHRAQLWELRQHVDRAIARGRLDARTWRVYTDRLRWPLGLVPVRHDRSLSYRATKKVEEIVAHAV